MSTYQLSYSVGIDALERLGAGLYSSPEQAISEFVANAYDADAERVDVTVSKDKIVVEDDGVGMDKAGVPGYFNIAQSAKRATGETTKSKGRAKIGSKGVGRLAVFYLGESFRLQTQKGGTQTIFEIDRRKLDRGVPLEGHHFSCVDKRATGHGTRLEIGNLKSHIQEAGIDCVKLREHLVRTMPRVADFAILVNGVRCTSTDVPAKRTVVVDCKLSCGRVRGTIVVARRELDQPGVSVTVRGRIVGRPTFFGFVTKSHSNRERFVTGTIEAAGLDSIISTSREGFNEAHPLYREFEKAMAEEVGVVIREEEAAVSKKESEASTRRTREMLRDVTKLLARAFPASQQAAGGEKNGEPGAELPKKPEPKKPKDELEDEPTKPQTPRPPKPKDPEAVRGPGKFSIDGRDYRLETRALGADEPECILVPAQGAIQLNIDHPSWTAAEKLRDQVPFVGRMLFDLIALSNSNSIGEARQKIDAACRTLKVVGGQVNLRRAPISKGNADEKGERPTFAGKSGPFLKRAANLKVGGYLVWAKKDWPLGGSPAVILRQYSLSNNIIRGRKFAERWLSQDGVWVITRTR